MIQAKRDEFDQTIDLEVTQQIDENTALREAKNYNYTSDDDSIINAMNNNKDDKLRVHLIMKD
jgi:hypothetical protein